MNHINTGSGYITTSNGYGSEAIGIVSSKKTPITYSFKRVTEEEIITSKSDNLITISPLLCYLKPDNVVFYQRYYNHLTFSLTPSNSGPSRSANNPWMRGSHDITKGEIYEDLELVKPSYSYSYWGSNKSYYNNVTEEYRNIVDSTNNLNIIQIQIHDPMGEAHTIWGN
jgi:hypothetical protein